MMLRARMPHPLAQLPGVTDDPNPWLLVAAATVVVVLLLVLLWPRFRTAGTRPSRSPARDAITDPSLAQQRSVERDMQTLMRELSEMARKIGAQLDAKSARLEALIRAADERAARLESFSGRGADADAGTDANGDASEPPRAAPPDIVIPPPASGTAHDPDPRHAQIYMLADQGFSSVQIAERLGYNEGEIELILALRPPRGRAGSAV